MVASFFFQAEDGIRDRDVTGVQTCALPIYGPGPSGDTTRIVSPEGPGPLPEEFPPPPPLALPPPAGLHRSEERRVGKDCRPRRGCESSTKSGRSAETGSLTLQTCQRPCSRW